MYQRQHVNNLGFIPWQLIVGAVDIATQSSLATASYQSQSKYLKKGQKLSATSERDAEAAKDIELGQRRAAAQAGLSTTRFMTDKVRKLVALGLIVTLIVATVGMGVAYSVTSKGGPSG